MGGVDFGELLTPFPKPNDLSKPRQEVLSDPAMVGQLVGHQATHSAVVLRTCKMNDADSAQVYLELQNWVENFTELSSLEGMGTILVQLWSMGFRSLEEIADTDRNAFLAEVASFNAADWWVRADHLTTLREAGLKTVDDLAGASIERITGILDDAGRGRVSDAERIQAKSRALIQDRASNTAWPALTQLPASDMETVFNAAVQAERDKRDGHDVGDREFEILVWDCLLSMRFSASSSWATSLRCWAHLWWSCLSSSSICFVIHWAFSRPS